VSSIEPNSCCSKIDSSEKVAGRLIVAGGNRPELLELTEKILNQVACLVQGLVIVALYFAVGLGRNDGGFAGLHQRLQHPLIGIVTPIGNHNRSSEGGQQGVSSLQITGLSGREQKTGRVAESIRRGMDLRAQPAFAATKGLVLTLFF
jgi:hypothetical protein